jgi:hypothetical protein
MRNRVVLAAVLAVVLLGLPASEAASSGHVQEFVTFDRRVRVPRRDQLRQDRQRLREHDLPRPDPEDLARRQPVGRGDHSRSGFGVAGLEDAPRGDVYVAVAAMDLATGQTDPGVRGVYVVTRAGVVSRLPGTEAMVFPNDVTIDERVNVYATDTAGGSV